MTDRDCTTENKTKQVRVVDTASFVKRSKSMHGNRFTYEHTVFTKSKDKIKVTCKKHGTKEMLPNSHFRRSGCRQCSNEADSRAFTQDEFIAKCKSTHGNRYDYSLTKYRSTVSDVKIICRIHGVFLKHARSHINGAGCPDCYEDTRVTAEEFLSRAKEKHGDKYDYSITRFERTSRKVDIICAKHGVFSQFANNHLEGKGCRRCATPNGYKSRDFKRVCDKNNNGKGVLYVIECKRGNEHFFKLGITSRTTSDRFNGNQMPYTYEVIYEFTEGAIIIYDLETKLHSLLRSNKYKPSIRFKGYTECFTSIKPIEKLLKRLESTEQLQLLA